MAKRKQKESLTLEEKLEAALVPEDEQPYEVPGNWCWVTIESINEYVSKAINPSKDKEAYYELYSVPSSDDDYPEMIKGKDIGSSKQGVMQGDVLLCKINPRINRVWKVSKYSDNELIASSEWIVVRNQRINTEFLMYCFRSQYFREYMLSNVSGVGGSLMRAKPQYVKKYPLPLPPLSEQQRIVDRIESLFSQLDEARDKAQEALDSFELRKNSLLQKAFSGELTEKWRRENRVNHDTWESMTLESLCESIYDGDHMPPPKSETGIPFLVISNVNDGYLSFENTRFVPEEYYNSLSKTRKPEKGDVLYTLVGSYGIPVVVDSDKPFCFQRHMGLLKPRKVDTYYLWYQLQSDVIYQKATAIATGTAQLTVPIKGLRKIEIAVPTMEEQQEIVRILNDVLGKERKLQEDITGIIEQVESTRKSILAKAFRGELGTNDPEDECAIELLKGILDDTREN